MSDIGQQMGKALFIGAVFLAGAGFVVGTLVTSIIAWIW